MRGNCPSSTLILVPKLAIYALWITLLSIAFPRSAAATSLPTYEVNAELKDFTHSFFWDEMMEEGWVSDRYSCTVDPFTIALSDYSTVRVNLTSSINIGILESQGSVYMSMHFQTENDVANCYSTGFTSGQRSNAFSDYSIDGTNTPAVTYSFDDFEPGTDGFYLEAQTEALATEASISGVHMQRPSRAGVSKTHLLCSCYVELMTTTSVNVDPGRFTGVAPHAALVSLSLESAGEHCSEGGTRIDTGLDNGDNAGTADDSVLQCGEIDQTSYVCNGAPGQDGTNGADGQDGAPGQDGANGADGQDGAPGQDGANGADGQDGAPGQDGANGADGQDGAPGQDGANGFTALVTTASEPVGVHCAYAGVRIDAGLDNGDGALGIAYDGILQADEVDSTQYVCNGAAGQDGTNGADGQDGAPGQDGADGTNGIDGQNGADGIASLIKMGTEASGLSCTFGGVKIEVGLDNGDGALGIARDGILQADEVDSTQYVCNGVPGQNGANGAAGQDGTNGVNGASGQDGANGFSALALTSAEPAGANCINGGTRIDVGLDDGSGAGSIAHNSLLDAGEVDSTSYVCSVSTGTSVATDATPNKGAEVSASTVGCSAAANSSSAAWLMAPILWVAMALRRRMLSASRK